MQLWKQLFKELAETEGRLTALEAQVQVLTHAVENDLLQGLKKNPQIIVCASNEESVDGGTYGGGEVSLPSEPSEKRTPEREGRSKKGGKTVGVGFEETLPEFPDLNTPEVVAALTEWYGYRRERNLAKWQQRTLRLNLEDYQAHGPSGFVAVIRQSIAKQWQGLFPLNAEVKPGKSQPSVMKPVQRSGDDDVRDEWFKLNSRAFGYIPKWPGAEAAKTDIEKLKKMLEAKRAASHDATQQLSV
jgi:hypothetical protein